MLGRRTGCSYCRSFAVQMVRGSVRWQRLAHTGHAPQRVGDPPTHRYHGCRGSAGRSRHPRSSVPCKTFYMALLGCRSAGPLWHPLHVVLNSSKVRWRSKTFSLPGTFVRDPVHSSSRLRSCSPGNDSTGPYDRLLQFDLGGRRGLLNRKPCLLYALAYATDYQVPG